jgi:hypothetical protein
VSFTPNVVEGQNVSLTLSAMTLTPPAALFTCTASAQPFSGSTGTLSFQFPSTLPTGTALLGRLSVDGVTSQVQVDLSAHPPTFLGPMVTV